MASAGLSRLDKGFESFGNKISSISAMQFGALAGIGLGVDKLIKSYEAQELAEKRLEVAIGRKSQALIDYASAAQMSTRFGDEMIIQSESLVGAFTRDEDQIKKVIQAAMDLSEAKGIDLVSATDVLTKSVFTESNMLGRLIGKFDATGTSTVKLEKATSRIAELYGGQAQAAAQTMSGRLTVMKNMLGEVGEAMGKNILTAMMPFVEVIKKAAIFLQGLPGPIQQAATMTMVLVGALRVLNLSLGPAGWFIAGITILVPALLNARDAMGDFRQEVAGFNADQTKAEIAKLEDEIKKFKETISTKGEAGAIFDKKQFEDVTPAMQEFVDTFKGTEFDQASIKLKNYEEHLKILQERLESFKTPDFGGDSKSKEALEKEKKARQEYYDALYRADKELYDKQMTNYEDFLAKKAEKDNEAIQSKVATNLAQYEADSAMRMEFLYTDEQNEIQSLADRLSAWNENWTTLKQGTDIFEKGVNAIRKKYHDQEVQRQQARMQMALSAMSDFFSSLAPLFEKNKSMQKAVMKAQALIDTYAAANRALATYPPPWSFVAAAAAIASGLGNVAKISSMARGGIVHAQTGTIAQGFDTVPAVLRKGEAVISAEVVRKNTPLITQLVGGKAPGAAGGQTANITVYVTVQAIDAKGVRDLINSDEYVRPFIEAINDTRINLRAGEVQITGTK